MSEMEYRWDDTYQQPPEDIGAIMREDAQMQGGNPMMKSGPFGPDATELDQAYDEILNEAYAETWEDNSPMDAFSGDDVLTSDGSLTLVAQVMKASAPEFRQKMIMDQHWPGTEVLRHDFRGLNETEQDRLLNRLVEAKQISAADRACVLYHWRDEFIVDDASDQSMYMQNDEIADFTRDYRA